MPEKISQTERLSNIATALADRYEQHGTADTREGMVFMEDGNIRYDFGAEEVRLIFDDEGEPSMIAIIGLTNVKWPRNRQEMHKLSIPLTQPEDGGPRIEGVFEADIPVDPALAGGIAAKGLSRARSLSSKLVKG